MWTEQCEKTEQSIEHGRPSVQKGMQHCCDHRGGRRNTQEFHPFISETIQVNKVTDKNVRALNDNHVLGVGVVIQVSLLN